MNKLFLILRESFVLAVLLMGMSHSIVVQAEEEEVLSGRELVAECEQGATPTTPNQYCMHFVFGLVQTMDMLQQAGEMPKLFCIDPNMIGLQEVTLRITNWLRERPDRLSEDAYILVGQALNQLYPCSAPGA